MGPRPHATTPLTILTNTLAVKPPRPTSLDHERHEARPLRLTCSGCVQAPLSVRVGDGRSKASSHPKFPAAEGQSRAQGMVQVAGLRFSKQGHWATPAQWANKPSAEASGSTCAQRVGPADTGFGRQVIAPQALRSQFATAGVRDISPEAPLARTVACRLFSPHH